LRMQTLLPVLLLSFLCFVVRSEAPLSTCRDLYPQPCARWHKFGFCSIEQYKPIMHNKCKMTCGYCDDKSRCQDMAGTERCGHWNNMGFCNSDFPHILKVCRSTCQQCSEIYCPRSKVRNGYFNLKEGDDPSQLPKIGINGVTAPGTVVNITCKPGFQVMGETSVMCQADGKYDKPLGVCVRSYECQVPQYEVTREGLDRYFLVSKVMDSNNMVSPGAFVLLVCQNGRKQQSFCSGFGTWLPALRDCDDDSAPWTMWYGNYLNGQNSNNSKREISDIEDDTE